jgi:hypothetical protein
MKRNWLLFSGLHRRNADRSAAAGRSVYRCLSIERLEDRCLLAADLFDPLALGAKSAAVEQSLSEVSLEKAAAAGFHLTTTASNAPVYLTGLGANSGDVQPALVQSRSLINMNEFRADPRFAGIDGHGFSSVIIDTGIDLNHPFFGPDAESNGIADRIVFQYDFSGSNDTSASDVDGHGSNVASIVASQDATYTGMAPGSSIIALKVFTDSGSGSFADVEEALQWVVANAATYNIASVNMSLGDSANYNSPTSLYGLGDELAALAAENVIVVSAAGNDYFQFQTQGVSYPAADANSLAVSAVWDSNNGGPITWSDGARDNSTGADRITSFSQRSTTMTTIFAPGAFITGANQSGGTVTYAGTSQASPHIAGIATIAQQLATQVLGHRLSMTEFGSLLKSTGASIFDGDDEDDNVTNTQQNYQRVDMLALGDAIWGMAIPGTDLEGTSFSVSPVNLRAAGGQAGTSFTVHNFGQTDASPFDVEFFLSDDATIDPATDIPLSIDPTDPHFDALASTAYHVAGGLASFADALGTVALDVPSTDPFGTDSQYYIGMYVDANGSVAEVDETNNLNRGDGLDRQNVVYSNTFSNPGAIAIPSLGSATPYPSAINVAGLTGKIADVNVSLLGFTHTFPDDVDVLLVGPAGQKMILMSDVGGSNNVNGINLLFDDSAGSLSNNGQLVSGTFKPTNSGTGDTFAAPAPGSPYSSTLSVFNDTVPNGVWKLFVVDDQSTDTGGFAGGWSLTFTLTNTAPTNPTSVLLPAIKEDVSDAENPGQLVSVIVASSGATDADGNVLGLAVTSVDNEHGQWQYEASGGSWQNLASASLSAGRLLGPAYYVRFVPNADYNVDMGAQPQFGFKAWDQTVGVAASAIDTTTGTAFSGATAIATQPVTAVNDAPRFTLASAALEAEEDAGPVSVAAFATGIAPGPQTATDEAGQTLAFQVTVAGTTGTLVFDIPPSIDPATGALTFAAVANTNGTATVDVVLQDSGSDVAPSVNISTMQQFVIAIAAVNDAPSFALASTSVSADEDAGSVSVAAFATDIVPGPAMATDEVGQTLVFHVSASGTTGTLAFDVAPAMDPVTGALTFTATADTFGTATIDVAIEDNGDGTPPNVNMSAVQQFVIEVAPVNDEQVLMVNTGATALQGTSDPITSALLETTDIDDLPADLLYVIAIGPAHGTISVDGTPATQFSQQQINDGLVVYRNDGATNTDDSFEFSVDDGKGAASSGMFKIAIRSNPGDYDRNLVVDAGDYVLWRKMAGTTGVVPYSGADGDGSMAVDDADFVVWQSHFGDAVEGASGEGGVGSTEAARTEELGASESPAESMAVAEAVARGKRVQAGAGVSARGKATSVASARRSYFARAAGNEATYHDSALLDWIHSCDREQRKYIGGADAIIGRAALETAKEGSCDALDVALAWIGEESV